MKKILLIFISLFLWTSCSQKVEEVIVESTPTPTPTIEVKEEQEEIIIEEEKIIAIGNSFIYEGNGEFMMDNNLMNIKVFGNSSYKVIQDSIYLKAGDHNVSMNINSDQQTDIIIRMYDDNSNLILEEFIKEIGYHEFSFNLPVTSYVVKLQLTFNTSDIETNYVVDNLNLNQGDKINNVKINQVGYQINAEKEAIFPNNNGGYFEIKDANTNDVVATFPLSSVEDARYTNERVQIGDFSEFKTPGLYYIESQLGNVSYKFEISDNVYDKLLDDAMEFFYVQRCSHEVNEEDYPGIGHDECHIELAVIESTGELIDVSGGWHDAGDYGKYVETAVKSLSDLLIGYMHNPEINNDIEYLNELQYELDWLLKMQRADGAIYSRVSTEQFPGYIMPDEDESTQYVLQVSTASSSGFAAVMSLASTVYRDVNPELADTYLNAALEAYKYVRNSSSFNPGIPAGFSIGNYVIGNDDFYRYYMGIALWYSTDNTEYLDYANTLIEKNDLNIYDTYWNPLILYPSYLYLEKADNNFENYNYINNVFNSYINNAADSSGRNKYNISLTDNYTWGSNQNIVDTAMAMIMKYELSNEEKYLNLATSHLDYVLGKNPLNYSFVTNYGSDYPQDIHHRITIVNNSAIDGALVGGANAGGSDPTVVEKFNGTNMPDAYHYVDSHNSYSTNEVALHYNSSLVFVLSYLNYK